MHRIYRDPSWLIDKGLNFFLFEPSPSNLSNEFILCSSFVLSKRSILVDLRWKLGRQIQKQIVLELPVAVDFAFGLLILEQRLLDAVLRVQLRISALIDVVKYCQWNRNLEVIVSDSTQRNIGFDEVTLTWFFSILLRCLSIFCRSEMRVWIFWLRTACPCGWKSETITPIWNMKSIW